MANVFDLKKFLILVQFTNIEKDRVNYFEHSLRSFKLLMAKTIFLPEYKPNIDSWIVSPNWEIFKKK